MMRKSASTISTASYLSVLLAVLVCASPALAQHERRFETTTEGGLAMTGNTLGLSVESDVNGPGTYHSIGTFITIDTSSVDNVPASTSLPWGPGTTNDWTQNSSSGELVISKDGEVLYAELIWGGSYGYDGASGAQLADLNTPITLSYGDDDSIEVTPIIPTGGVCDRIQGGCAATFQDLLSVAGFAVNYYMRSVDVSEFVIAHGEGVYTAAGIPGTQSHTVGGLNAAGWMLVVAYYDPALPARNLTIFVGADWVDEPDPLEPLGANWVEYDVTGFCTPPTGPVTGSVLLSALEGDASLGGDQVFIAGPAGEFVPLSSPNNPEGNFFGSQVNDVNGSLDITGTFGECNHDPSERVNEVGCRQGWDITGVALSEDAGQIDNEWTSATIRATSAEDADSYVATLVALAIDINSPTFAFEGISSVSVDEADIGDEIVYTVNLDNTEGTADADAVVFFAPLPSELSLVSFSIDETVVSDVDGSDLTTGVNVGIVPNGEVVVVSFTARVESIPGPPAEATFTVEPSWEYEYISCAEQSAILGQSEGESLVVGAPRLELTVLVVPSDTLAPEATATITVTVENTGAADTKDATLVVTIPSGLSYLAGSTTLDSDSIPDVGGSMPFLSTTSINASGQSAGVIGPDEQVVISFQAQVDSDATGSLNGTVTIDSDGAGPAPTVLENYVITVSGDAPAICGNGVIETGETCDDTNTDSGDGCSDACQTEDGWTCVGEPSVCTEESDDRDGDGLSDSDEAVWGTDPDDPDTDDDGLSDGVEVYGENQTNPLDPDSDDDELCDGPASVTGICEDGEDQNADGSRDDTETDPNNADTDGGTVPDGAEVFRGTNPLDPSDDLPDDGSRVIGGGDLCGCRSVNGTEQGIAYTILLSMGLMVVLSRRRRK